MKIPFNRYESCKEAHSNVSDTLDGDEICQVQKLEEEFIKYVGCSYALATSHGTSALHLAMLSLDLKRGDKVVCSVNTYPSIPEVVRHFDAEPVFIDIDEDSYNIDLDKLESYLEDNQSKKLKAVIVTHIAGATPDLNRLYNMGEIYNVKIVEDASDALGTTYNGTKIGDAMFSGDFIFERSIGRCDFPYSSAQDMKESLEKFKKLDYDKTVYPGHGGTTTIKQEQQYADYWIANI